MKLRDWDQEYCMKVAEKLVPAALQHATLRADTGFELGRETARAFATCFEMLGEIEVGDDDLDDDDDDDDDFDEDDELELPLDGDVIEVVEDDRGAD